MKLRKRFFYVLMSIFLILGITACSASSGAVYVTFEEEEYVVKENGSLKLDVNIEAGSEYNLDEIRSQLVYSSFDESVAVVDKNGILTGVGYGETEIMVEWSEKAIVFNKVKVTVLQAALPGVVFGEYDNHMLKGESQTITYSFDTIYTDALVKWESSDESVLKVNKLGVVEAVGAGEAKIILSSTDGAEYKPHEITITVEETDFAINYELNGGVNAESNPAGYNYFGEEVVFAAPSKAGFEFAGWYGNAELEGELVTGVPALSKGEVNVYAKWDIITYGISYVLNEGEHSGNPETYTVLDEIKLAPATKEHYDFLGWYDAEGNKVEEIVASTGDLVLEAKWEKHPYAISYDLDGGVNAESNPETYVWEEEVVLAPATKLGYAFLGWYDAEGNKVEKLEAGASGDVALAAKWEIISYAISYELNEGTHAGNPESYTVLDEVVLAPAAKEHYVFLGWYDAEGNKVEKIALGSVGDVAVAAKFEKEQYAITYNLDGGVNAEANPAYYVWEQVVELAPATKAGYAFLGWYDAEGNKVEKIENGASGAVEVSAKWEIVSYTITYDVVVEGNPESYNVNDDVTLLAPAKEYYVFLGWYDAEGNKVENLLGLTGDLQLTAKFEKEQYAITYHLDGGENDINNPAYYTYDQEVVFADPSKDYHLFLGWFDAEGNKVEKIEAGSTVAVEVYAKWESLACDIEYELNGGSFPNPYPYSSHAELVAEFIVDFNAHSGKKVAADGSDFFARSYMADGSSAGYKFLTSAEYSAKWGWLLNLLNDVRAANGIAAIAATDGQAVCRGEIHNFLNQNQGYPAYGCDYTNVKYEEYSVKYMPKDPSVNSPVYEYVPGQTTALPTPEKENHGFAGWGVAEDVTITTSANSNFWGNYASHVFLFKVANDPKAKFSFRVYITWTEAGYVVSKIQPSGEASEPVGDYLIVISDSHANVKDFDAFKETVKVGQVVVFDGDPTTGNTTVKLYNAITEIGPEVEGDLHLEALWVELKDNHALSYEVYGGELSEGAPKEYLTSTGLKLEAVASKPGYTFVGWSLTAGGNVVTEIPQGTRGDLVLYAVYEAVEYKIEYELNGGTFSVDSVAPIYDSYDALVADFIADYSEKFGLSGITAANFYSKSSSFGLVNFWKDAELSTKWAWLQEFILGYQANYAGLSAMKNPSSPANYNKYWRANLAAFLQKGKITSPLSMNFAGVDSEQFWAEVVPTKVVTVAANPTYSYTVEQLPLVLEVPMREGVEFLGWCLSHKLRDEFDALPAGTVGDVKLYAKWSDSEEVYETYKINYELDYGRFESEYVDEYTETVGLASLPVPVKVGYTFLGWTLEADSKEYVTSIGVEVTGEVTLYAQWTEKESSLPKIIYVGAEQEYKTLADALAAASKGDTIVVEAGTYEGGTISKSVTIKGPNADINPNTSERKAEAVITGDLIVAADNVVINGINLDGVGRIKTDDNSNINNLDLCYILVTNNSHSSSTDTCFNLTVNSSYTVSNVTLRNSRIEKGKGRQMIMITNNIHNLVIDNNEFYGAYSTYNDALKLANGGTSGVTGNLEITNNHFEGYAQYMVWMMKYGAVDVELSNNSFKQIGQSAGSHAIIRFATFTGSESDKVALNMTYNTLEEGYMVLRIDAASSLSADNSLFVVNYNEVISTADTVLVKNSSTAAKVTCDSNYWGIEIDPEKSFVNATHTNDLVSVEDMPSQEEIWLEGKLIVGEGQTYATIADALAAAKEGDEIYLTAGTYNETVTITVANITIYGPNHGVHGNAERAAEAVLVQPISVEADGVVIDGVKLSAGEDSYASLKVAANNIVVTNIYSDVPAKGNPDGGNRDGVIWTNSAISDLTVSNSYVNIGSTSYTKSAFVAYESATNITIKNNVLTHNSTSQSSVSEAIVIAKAAGVINILDNDIIWITDNWSIMMDNCGSVTELNIIGNYIDGAVVDGTSYYNCGFRIRYIPAGAVLNIIHNEFGYLAGTTLDARYSNAAGEVNIKYNVLTSTKWKINYTGDATFNYDSNYFGQPQTTTTPDYGIVTDPAKVEELYEAYKIVQSIGTPEVYSNISYEVNGGTIEAGYDVKYLEGQKVAIYPATKEGYKFLGWTLEADSTSYITSISKDVTGDITLYAHWAEIFDIEYDLGEGSCEELVYEAVDGTTIKLPTPEKYGHIFLGWTLEAGSEEYVKEITVTSDVKLYANWLEATFYYVTYELNGGSIKYASRADLVNDFIKDYNAIIGTSYASADDIPTGSFTDINYHTFLLSTSELENGQTPIQKWSWLVEYLYELSVRDVASNNCNVLGLADIIDGGSFKTSGDNMYGVSYAFRAFLKGIVIRPGTSYTSVDHSVYENANGFWGHLSPAEQKVYGYYKETTLPAANLENYKFDGWYKEADFSGEAVTVVNHEIVGEGLTLYARFVEANPVTSITIDNKISEIKRFETYQLTWTILPTDANIQTVEFKSSNPEVATIDDKGFINCLTDGTTTITITSKSSSGASDSFVLEVYSPDHFAAEYETESYVEVDGQIKLLAQYILRDKSVKGVSWSSLNEDIATVDENGVVTALNPGLATIRATVEEGVYFDFVVTVLEEGMSDALKQVVESHESNVFVRYDLGIGAGTPAYYSDIFGSVSKIFYNHKLSINEQYKAAGDASNDYYANSTVTDGLEFITVHYTAGFDATADTDNHASYFTSGNADVSIHYVTGNAGSDSNGKTSEVYSTLSHQHGAWHAGDSGSRYYSNSTKKNDANELVFTWMPTGVKYDGADLLHINWTASDDLYYEINGQKTSIKLPTTWNYNNRNTDHIYNTDGTVSSQPDFCDQFTWGKPFENRPIESFFNDQGFPVKVIDGEYYMGPTWWNFSQVLEGMICGSGGNRSSIGIESCVNRGSDLWYTWQVTAQLVASLMVQYDLGIERVKGHHFFDGKDCPQPMLENDLEIWWEFLELVEAEYELLTTYKDVTYSMEVSEDSASVISENGRVIEQPEFSQVVTYTVTVTNGDKVETITLASAVEGVYNK